MRRLYYYRICGLITASEVYLPEAEPVGAAPDADVTVLFGSLEYDISQYPGVKNPGGIWYYCFVDYGRMLFRSGGIDFEVSGGSRIVIDTHGGDRDSADLHIYLLGTAFGTIHMQRGNVPVHGASIEGRSGATIITGYSGSGKSAVLGALALDGFHFLADDVSVVTTENGIPEVLPGYPQRKIACDDAVSLGYDVAGLEVINEDNRDKYVIRRPGEWRRDRMRLSAVVEITRAYREDGERVDPVFREIKGQNSLRLVMRNLYRSHFYGSTGIMPDIMKKILVLTSGIRTYQLIRPYEGMSVWETAELIVSGCEGIKRA